MPARLTTPIARCAAAVMHHVADAALTQRSNRLDFRSRGDWLTRAYAVALRAGTQV